MKKFIFTTILMIFTATTQADWVATPTSGSVSSVRTYQIGTDGLRAQIMLSGANHDCGTGPNTFYFDTGKVPADVVKAVISLAFGAMVAGKPVRITYDCSLHGGGYGWGVALSVSN